MCPMMDRLEGGVRYMSQRAECTGEVVAMLGQMNAVSNCKIYLHATK